MKENKRIYSQPEVRFVEIDYHDILTSSQSEVEWNNNPFTNEDNIG